MKKSTTSIHTATATNKKSNIKQLILLLILFFVFYNYFMIGSTSTTNSSKEVALKHVQDYVIQLEQDVSRFQHIIENNIKPNNGITIRPEDKVSGSDIGTNLRGITKNLGLKSMKDLYTISKDIIKPGTNWRDSISSLLGLSFISSNTDRGTTTTTNSDVNDIWAKTLKTN